MPEYVICPTVKHAAHADVEVVDVEGEPLGILRHVPNDQDEHTDDVDDMGQHDGAGATEPEIGAEVDEEHVQDTDARRRGTEPIDFRVRVPPETLDPEQVTAPGLWVAVPEELVPDCKGVHSPAGEDGFEQAKCQLWGLSGALDFVPVLLQTPPGEVEFLLTEEQLVGNVGRTRPDEEPGNSNDECHRCDDDKHPPTNLVSAHGITIIRPVK